MNNWKVVEDCDAYNYVLEINHKKYGRYVWVTETIDGYNVEVCIGNSFKTLMTCKSLPSAKRWVAVYLQ